VTDFEDDIGGFEEYAPVDIKITRKVFKGPLYSRPYTIQIGVYDELFQPYRAEKSNRGKVILTKDENLWRCTRGFLGLYYYWTRINCGFYQRTRRGHTFPFAKHIRMPLGFTYTRLPELVMTGDVLDRLIQGEGKI
jgi:hypothetical protein